jgi:membrane-bound lytic murein transglycosylase A
VTLGLVTTLLLASSTDSTAASQLLSSTLLARTNQPSSSADDRLWNPRWNDKRALLRAIDHSLRYLRTQRAAAAYQRQSSRTGITRSHVQRSVLRFRGLLRTSSSAQQFQAALEREFAWYQSIGYYRPLLAASRVRTSVYRYPLYRLPRSFRRWPRPHPTRAQLEGTDGLRPSPLLRGAELVWLRDRLDAYLVQVQGSAQLRLTGGKSITLGYAGHTVWPYTSMGRELVKYAKLTFEELTLPLMVA